jgi:hypothetical protein
MAMLFDWLGPILDAQADRRALNPVAQRVAIVRRCTPVPRRQSSKKVNQCQDSISLTAPLPTLVDQTALSQALSSARLMIL